MGDEIKINGKGNAENAEETKKKQAQEQARAEEQGKQKVEADLTAGLSGSKSAEVKTPTNNGSVFGTGQMTVDEQGLKDLSNQFLGFTLGVSQMPFGLGENIMMSTINTWFQAFMGLFKGGNQNTGTIGGFGGIGSNTGTGLGGIGGGTTTLIKDEAPADDTTITGADDADKPAEVKETPEAEKARKASEAKEAEKAKKAKEAASQAAADKKAIEDGDLTKMNRSQFLKWLDKKGYKSEMTSDKDLIDYVDESGYKNRIRFNKTEMPSLIYQKDKSTTINYQKDGSKTITVNTDGDERYSYSEVSEYDKTGKKTSYKKTERDAGNYFKRQWVGISGVEYETVSSRKFNLKTPIKGLQDKTQVPEFKSGNAGYTYDPQKGTLDGKDTTYTKLKDGSFSATDKKTGATYHYDKNGKLTKQIDPKNGIIRDFKTDGSYDEHYNRDWVHKK